MIVFEGSLHADGVQPKVLDVAQFLLESLGGRAEGHLRGPAAAPNQDVLSVHRKAQVAIGVDMGGELADAKTPGSAVGEGAVDLEAEFEVVQVRFSELGGPPQLRLLKHELGKVRWGQAYLLLAGGEGDLGGDLRRADTGMQDATQVDIHGVVGHHFHGQLGPIRPDQLGHHLRVAEHRRARGAHGHRAEQSHHLVGRHGVPVHKGEGESVRARSKHLHRQHVGARQGHLGDVELVSAPGAGGVRRFGNPEPVEPHVRHVVDGAEPQPHLLAAEVLRQGELGAVPPRHPERAVVVYGQDGEIGADLVVHARKVAQVHAEVRIRVGAVGHQGADDRGGDCGRVPFGQVHTRRREGFAGVSQLGRGLDPPAVPQLPVQASRGGGLAAPFADRKRVAGGQAAHCRREYELRRRRSSSGLGRSAQPGVKRIGRRIVGRQRPIRLRQAESPIEEGENLCCCGFAARQLLQTLGGVFDDPGDCGRR